jgi:hypothetical protein
MNPFFKLALFGGAVFAAVVALWIYFEDDELVDSDPVGPRRAGPAERLVRKLEMMDPEDVPSEALVAENYLEQRYGHLEGGAGAVAAIPPSIGQYRYVHRKPLVGMNGRGEPVYLIAHVSLDGKALEGKDLRPAKNVKLRHRDNLDLRRTLDTPEQMRIVNRIRKLEKQPIENEMVGIYLQRELDALARERVQSAAAAGKEAGAGEQQPGPTDPAEQAGE